MSLRALGFSDVQERVYRALLGSPTADLASLATATALSELQLREALDVLADHEVIRIDPGGITVPDPRIALSVLIERIEDGLLARLRDVSGARSEVSDLYRSYTATPDAPAEAEIERIEGVDAVREKIAELSFFARSSVHAIQPGGPQSAESLAAGRPLDLRAIRRNMRLRVIHERSIVDDEPNRSYLHDMVLLGVEARLSDQLAERMIILDEQVAIVPIDPKDSRRGALVVRHPGLVTGLLDLFQRTWDAADELPWQAPTAPSGVAPTEQDLRLLTLLASGSTDDAVAREFDVSVRHLRRRIARLMSTLSARSRFEAGAEAARRGWL